MRARLLRLLAVIAAALLVSITAGGASSAAPPTSSSYFTGYGFDTCKAPSFETMEAWLESPYRAIGIYLGGSNRACPDGNLTPAWVNSVRAIGWNFLPLWVDRQAACVSQKGLSLISSGSAESQGQTAADEAAARAAYFGIEAGNPIYYDMEGYKATASCTDAVQRFVSAWVTELHAKGYTAGVYGSANSTIRDLDSMLESNPDGVPDDIWIARWNGVKEVFGEPVVSDSYWGDHQRVHQYQGGHKETYGGVTVNIDSNYVDGAVVPAAATLPIESPAGTAYSSDGKASVSWWGYSFNESVVVTPTLTPTTLAIPLAGFSAGSYVLQLQTVDALTGVPISRFNTLLAIHVIAPPQGIVAFSSDGQNWKPIRRLSSAALPVGSDNGYLVEADGSLDIYTLVPGYFALLQDIAAPTTPTTLKGRFIARRLMLKWRASSDNSGAIASYQVTLNGVPIQTLAGTATSASLNKFKKKGRSIYRVRAIDAASNKSPLSSYIKVVNRPQPSALPHATPRWAWRMLDWQAKGRKGKRPNAPRPLPRWFWHWVNWKLSPHRIVR